MSYADTTERQAFIAGLRKLAEFLEINPRVPVPEYGAEILVFPPSSPDDEKRREIDLVAFLIGSGTATSCGGHYSASRRFGPVGYRAVAIPASETTEG